MWNNKLEKGCYSVSDCKQRESQGGLGQCNTPCFAPHRHLHTNICIREINNGTVASPHFVQNPEYLPFLPLLLIICCHSPQGKCSLLLPPKRAAVSSTTSASIKPHFLTDLSAAISIWAHYIASLQR